MQTEAIMKENAYAQKSVPTAYHCATLVGNWQEERTTFGAKPEEPANRKIGTATTYSTSHTPFTAAEMQKAKSLGYFSAGAPKELLFYHGDITKPDRNEIGLDELGWTDRRKVTYTNDEMLDMPGVSAKNQRSANMDRTLGASSTSGASSATGAADRTRALERESQLIRSMNGTTMSATAGRSADGAHEGSGDDEATSSQGGSAYCPPSLPPVGRVAERERLLTTKNVTHDATGAYLFDHTEHYPLTSTATIADMVKSRDNPMHKTKLRVEYKND